MYTGNLNNNISRSVCPTIKFSKGNKFGDSNSPYYHPKLANQEATDQAEIALYKSFYPTAPAKVNLYMPDENIENILVASYGGFRGAGNGKGILFARSDGTTFSFIEDPAHKGSYLVADGVLTRDITVNGTVYKAGGTLPHMMELDAIGFPGMKMIYTAVLYGYIKEMLDNGVFWLASFTSHALSDGENAAKSLAFAQTMMGRFHKSLFEFPITIGKQHVQRKLPTGGKREFSYWDIKPMSSIGQRIIPQEQKPIFPQQPAAVQPENNVFVSEAVAQPEPQEQVNNVHEETPQQMSAKSPEQNVKPLPNKKFGPADTLTREEIEELLAPLNTDIPDHLCTREVIQKNWPEILDMSTDYLTECIKKADAFFLDVHNNPDKYKGQDVKVRSAGAKRQAYISAYLIAVLQQ